MKKRIVCILLTLIMLVSLVPAAALSAAAASNAISESAIYVLKQLQEYKLSNICNGTFIGYGTKCPDINKKDHDADNCTVFMYEYQADKALREELAKLDKAVNSFADRIGRGFSQNQHDALVLFSYANGTAWTMGTGTLQTAIKSGYTGSQFVDAICKWDLNVGDDNRRMIEANMYLNNVYSAAKPSRFIRVDFEKNSEYAGLPVDRMQYYDVASPVTITVVPTTTAKDTTFRGWYTAEDGGERVTTLTSKYHEDILYALWQSDDEVLGRYDETGIAYTIKKSVLSSTTVYNTPNGDKVTKYIDHNDKEATIKLEDTLNVTADYVDSKGVRWARIVDVYTTKDGDIVRFIGWVKVKGATASGSASSSSMDVTVTVTNTYVNMRKSAGVGSTQVGTCKQGEQLRIVNTKNASTDSFLWGQVVDAEGKTRGWVALQYTDYNSVVANMNSSASVSKGNVIATATITYTGGYVNVRSEAGINNQIVGALSQGMTVDLYQVKYVNSVLWGLTDMGWFCLSYANVSNLSSSNVNTGTAGFGNFVFDAVLDDWDKETVPSEVFVKEPNGEAVDKIYGTYDDGNKYEKPMTSANLVLSNLMEDADGNEWAKTSYGWIELTKVSLKPAKFYVIVDTLTVREGKSNDSKRVDVLLKGTEFDVTEIDIIGKTIWAKAEKAGDPANDDKTYNEGYVNLDIGNVSRNGAPQVSIGGSGASASTTVKMAKVVGTDRLRVRMTGSTYGKQLGTLAYGTTAAILGEKNGWYKLDIDVDNDPSTDSWVSGQYLEIYEAAVGSESSSNGTTSGTVETGMGIVANTYTGVNIRTAPGTGSAAVGKYMVGTAVEILEVREHGTTKWGRTDKGWVCMDYIAMTEKYPVGSGSTGSSGSNTLGTEVAIYTGRAVDDDVKVYKSTDLKDTVVRTLNQNDAITLHELLVVQLTETEDVTADDGEATTTITRTTQYWARVNDGYIYAPGEGNIELDVLDEHVYTLAQDAPLYDDAGGDELEDSEGAKIVLKKGANVVVTTLKIKNGNVWGWVEGASHGQEGWTKMSHMTKGFASSVEPEEEEKTEDEPAASEPTAPSVVVGSTGSANSGTVGATGTQYTGKVIRTNSVNVRATASTSATATTTLKGGAALNIYETVISEGMAWGRCDAGWVYLYYVDLTPVGNGAVDAKVVYTENTPIYADMNMTQATGSTYTRMAVVNIYEVVGKMNRTDLGWVHSDNLG